jgi:hypothetical protein
LGVGDLTGDGKPDLASRDSAGKLWLFPGDGHGGIGSRREISGGWNHFDLLNGMGDLTNDGIPDIAARSKVSKLVYIYPGDGAGGLGPRIGGFAGFSHLDFLAAGGRLGALGHGHSDLVGRNSKGKLVVFDNNGRRNIGSVVDTGSTFSNANLVLNVGDWNGDGHGDVMTRSATSGNVYLRTGDGASHFSAPVLVAKSWNSVRLLAPVGDITGDGFPDLMGQPAGGAMRIYPGDGSTGFKRSYVAHSAIAASRQVGVGLWNGDGSPDSVMRTGGGSLTLYPGNGPGGLTTGHKIGSRAGRYDWIIGAGDVNGDGEPDLVARSRVSGKLWLLPGNGSQVEPRRLIAAGFGKYDLGG